MDIRLVSEYISRCLIDMTYVGIQCMMLHSIFLIKIEVLSITVPLTELNEVCLTLIFLTLQKQNLRNMSY